MEHQQKYLLRSVMGVVVLAAVENPSTCAPEEIQATIHEGLNLSILNHNNIEICLIMLQPPPSSCLSSRASNSFPNFPLLLRLSLPPPSRQRSQVENSIKCLRSLPASRSHPKLPRIPKQKASSRVPGAWEWSNLIRTFMLICMPLPRTPPNCGCFT